MDLTPASLKALFQAYKNNFQQGFDSLGADGALYEQFATVVPSTTAVEVYPFLKTLPRMREWVGDRVIHSLEAGDFSIKNRTFELTVEVLESNPVCYDGQPLFDADHPVLDKSGKEVSKSNDIGGAGPAWYVMDLSRMIRPLVFQRRRPYDFRAITDLNDHQVFMTDKFLFGVDARVNAGPGLWQLIVRSNETFNAANYEIARKRLQELKGDYERPLGLRHTHTMVPQNLEGPARKVITNSLATGGETNEWANTSTLILNPWLANS